LGIPCPFRIRTYSVEGPSAGLDGELLHGSDILKYALGWGLVFLMVAFFEESTLRGYLQFTLTRGIGFWWGALLLSLLFGFSHGTIRARRR